MTAAYRLRTVADLDSLTLLRALFEELSTANPDVGSLDLSLFETAIVELVNNLVEHGVLPDGGRPVDFTVEIDVEADRLSGLLSATGVAPLDPAGRTLPEVWAESGRGLVLAESLVDELAYSRTAAENVWRIVRNRTVA